MNNNLQLIDNQLLSLGLVRKEIPKDGACLFRCISEYIYGTQIKHRYVREKCIEYLEKNRERFEPFACINDPWERYIELMAKDDTWGGEIELQALSLYYRVNFVIYIGTTTTCVDNSYPITISLAYCQGEHYDIVYPITHMNLLKSMQSIIYELLADTPQLAIKTDTSQWYNTSIIWWEEEVKIKQKKDMKIVETLNMNKRVYINPVDEFKLKQKKEKERLEREKEKNKKKAQQQQNKNRSIIRSSGDSDTSSGGGGGSNSGSIPSSPAAPSSLNNSANNNEVIYPAMEEMDEELRAIIKQIEQQDIEEQRKLGMEKHFPTLAGGKQNRNNKNRNQQPSLPSPSSSPLNNKTNENQATVQPTSTSSTTTTTTTQDNNNNEELSTVTVTIAPAWKTAQDWNQVKNMPVSPTPTTTTAIPTTPPTATDQSSNSESDNNNNNSNNNSNSNNNFQFKIKNKNRK
ncbi:hypothetical protein PPL_06863 [Heterostelium album PN500]|uniref:OTU domain-containing protein n=1 Tax=Heterostelium pallidum (strain ATCC 26659 / Pp 5 / PN500) TaxID=670386 RepID=D3BDR1_HETP5|nr:hypothetical protein PPL_06863 [Heterostelium album PN500]EFA80042.1 hypothetical protein PPL_06863 [Heterostelium album PN500]|eukprot:XP_020432162.1 hypothetical protein PPL_06863 [Heterostelium album PN500]